MSADWLTPVFQFPACPVQDVEALAAHHWTSATV